MSLQIHISTFHCCCLLHCAVDACCVNMGSSQSKSDKVKRNKNHNRQKMFRFGISFGRNDLNLEGHLQMGYNSKTIKNYSCVEQLTNNKGIDEQIKAVKEKAPACITPKHGKIIPELNY